MLPAAAIVTFPTEVPDCPVALSEAAAVAATAEDGAGAAEDGVAVAPVGAGGTEDREGAAGDGAGADEDWPAEQPTAARAARTAKALAILTLL